MPVKTTLKIRPNEPFDIPDRSGYYIHNQITNDINYEFNTLSISLLTGNDFEVGKHPHTTRLNPEETYTIKLSVTDNSEKEKFEHLTSNYTKNNNYLRFGENKFNILQSERKEETIEDIYTKAKKLKNPELKFNFRTPTCILHPASGVTEKFPHRIGIFPDLANKWNEQSTDHRIHADPFDVGANLLEEPKHSTCDTDSVLTDINKNLPVFRQGFVGECTYKFRNPSEQFVQNIISLSVFSTYSGVGIETHRGCGSTSLKINKSD